MVGELIRALFLAGIPVGLASFALVWWSLRQGYLESAGSVRELEQGIRLISRQRREERKRRKAKKKQPAATDPAGGEQTPLRRIDPVHRKWLAFGGGFYGIVGLLTYAVVEFGELRDFFTNFESLAALLREFGINMVVNLLVDALMNFVVAIAWPVYWMSAIAMNHVWIWFGVAYLAYWAGVKLAVQRFGQAAVQTAP